MKRSILLAALLLNYFMACKEPRGGDGSSDATAETSTAGAAPETVTEKVIYQRAFQSVIWGMPAVNYYLMYKEMVDKVKGGYNQVVYWSGLLNWKNQTLTPNPDVIYLMPFFNTKEVGPMVLEVPPADNGIFFGSVMDYWQAAMEDIGPGGGDKGHGGRYLILAPDHAKDKIPAGYIPLRSATYQGYALLRSALKQGGDAGVQQAVEYARRIKLYPLSQASHPPPTTFLDAQNILYDATIPYDFRFFKALDAMVQSEPFLERDKVMIEQLRSIGIVRGQPFNPDKRTQELMESALLDAKVYLDDYYESFESFYPGKRWFFPVHKDFSNNVLHDFKVPDTYPLDNRGMIYSIAFFSAKHVGESQFYLLDTRDKAGNVLDGGKNYKLTMPGNVPVNQYWSVTVYDRATHGFIKKLDRQGRSSQSSGLQVNADGSVDIYFGPRAPVGKEPNWVATMAGGKFELMARFYGIKQEFFTKEWVMNDVEEVK